MRTVDYFIRSLTVVSFVALLLDPDRWGTALILLCFMMIGLWALLYPQGVLGWARSAHRQIDVEDRSTWWVPRLIGSLFLVVVFFILFISMGTHRWR